MTKKAKREKANAIKAKGNPVNQADTMFLIQEIFINHPDWINKKGIGIKRIYSDHDGRGQRCFFIERTDRTVVPISVPYSLRPLTKKQSLKQILRDIITPQIEEFRKSVDTDFEVCGISGEELEENFHIDHIKSFDSIAEKWLSKYDVNELYENTHRINKGRIGERRFNNDFFNTDWYEYHLTHAALRPANKFANLSRGKKL